MGEKLFDKLNGAVSKYNRKKLDEFDDLINNINTKIESCASDGYTNFLIQFTSNDLAKVGSTTRATYVLRCNNATLRKQMYERLKNYYESQGLKISNRYNDDYTILISWGD